MQSIEANFEAPNFTCAWNFANNNSQIELLVLVDKTLTVVSPINGVVATHALDGPSVATAAWVREHKSAGHSLIALGAENTVTIRDSLTWAVVAQAEGLIEADGNEIGKLNCCVFSSSFFHSYCYVDRYTFFYLHMT